MLKVGLTGGIGTGKSTVSDIFKNFGIKIIDADIISREVLSIYPEILENIKLKFGAEFFNEDGTLRRRLLGDYVFKSNDRKKELEDIIMPFIKKEIFKRLKEYEISGEKVCILDAPTLIENDFSKFMDINILVWVDKNTQINRVKRRDNMSYDDVVDRINSQMQLDEKKKFVDIVIDNTGSFDMAQRQVKKVINLLGV